MFWQKTCPPPKPKQGYAPGSLTHVPAGPHSIGLPKHHFSLQQLLPTCLCMSLNSTLHSPASRVFTFCNDTLKFVVTPTYSCGGQSLCSPESRQCLPPSPTAIYSHNQNSAVQNTEGKQKGLKGFLPVSSQKNIFSMFMPFHCNQFLL